MYTASGGDSYIQALCLEAQAQESAFQGRIFESVYLGGGTPTVLSFDQLKGLMDVVKRHFRLSPDAEWTMEANPNSLTGRQLELAREGGVNRLSLGVQSFDDELLKALGRPHGARESVEAFRTARTAGFTNISLDLIYGIPGQSPDQWDDTLGKALGLNPEHLSAYSLSLDEGSCLMREAEAGRFALPDDEPVAELYEHAVKRLGEAGYERYEISNFSLSGFACRHNGNYWARGEYLGLGPGAWTFVSGRRSHTIGDVREYVRRMGAALPAVAWSETVGPRQAANETIMLRLRTKQGLDLRRYHEEFGSGADRELKQRAAPLVDAGWLVRQGGCLLLTEKGILLANEVLERLSC